MTGTVSGLLPANNQSNRMKQPYRFLLKIIAGAGLSLLSAQDPFVLDTSLTNVLPKSLTNSIQIADMNNDGTNDIILSGYDETRNGVFFDVINVQTDGTLLLGSQNSFITYSDTIAGIEPGVPVGGIGGIDLIDYNRDGWIDAFLQGSALKGTLIIWRFACSVAFRIASGTSFALPLPYPTLPFWSPTTTRAAKPKRLPPFTVFDTRLIATKRS